jgi:hypothetical protein
MDVQRKLAVAGLVAGLLGGGAAGLVLANAGVSGAAPAVLTQQDDAPDVDAPDEGSPDAQAEDDGADRDCRGEGEGPRHRAHRGIDAAAEALGITEEELHQALRDGATIAQVAGLQGVDVQVVIDAMVAEARAHLDEKVAEGTLTQEEADERLAEVTERITDMVNNGRPEGDRGHRGQHGGWPSGDRGQGQGGSQGEGGS